MPNALYSFGIAPPGAINLHNYPYFLQNLERPNGEILDLAATDILRSRERGVPRYCRFRELFHLERPRSFEDLTSNGRWAEELRQVYEGDLDRVDVTAGMYAEAPPQGCGFSDTAFRVFVLMATRRLKSDRFFTSDYRPEVYTQAGLDWIDSRSMRTVLFRHFPQLEPALAGVENAFAPWKRCDRAGQPYKDPASPPWDERRRVPHGEDEAHDLRVGRSGPLNRRRSRSPPPLATSRWRRRVVP